MIIDGKTETDSHINELQVVNELLIYLGSLISSDYCRNVIK